MVSTSFVCTLNKLPLYSIIPNHTVPYLENTLKCIGNAVPWVENSVNLNVIASFVLTACYETQHIRSTDPDFLHDKGDDEYPCRDGLDSILKACPLLYNLRKNEQFSMAISTNCRMIRLVDHKNKYIHTAIMHMSLNANYS